MMHVPRPQLVAALAGAAVPLSAMAAFAVRRLFRVTPPSSAPIATWTVSQVSDWLRAIGATKATVTALQSHGVNGGDLCVFTAPDLLSMGVSARDARLIMAAREDYLHETVVPRTPLPIAAPRLSTAAFTSPQGVPPSHGVRLFMRSAEDLLSSANMVPHDAEEEDAHKNQTARQLYALLDVFRELSQTDQTAAMDPLGRQLLAIATMPTPRARVSVVPTERAASITSATPAHTPQARARSASADAFVPREPTTVRPASPLEDVSAKMAPLDAMVDNFLRLLTSDEFARVPAAEFNAIASRVKAQIERIRDVSTQVPTPEGRALQQKCALALRLIAEAQSRPTATAPSTSAAASPDKVAAPRQETDELDDTVNDLMKRLEEVFRVANDPATRAAPPPHRLAHVQRLKAEVAAIQAEAAELHDDRRDVLLQVSARVAALLEEMSSLSQNEAQVSPDDVRTSSAAATPSQVALISTAVREVLQVLQSPEFNAAPPPVKAQVSETLLHRIAELRQVCVQLPPVDGEPLIEVLDGVVAMLQPQKPEASSETQAAPATRGVQTAEGEDTPAESPLDIIAEQLEKILALLNSQAFRQAPGMTKAPVKAVLLPLLEVLRSLQSSSFNEATDEAKMAYVAQVKHQLNAIMEASAAVPAPFREAVETCVSDTAGLLQAEADYLVERRTEQTASRRASTQADALDGIIEQASNLFSFVTSEAFEKADPAAKRRIALDAIPRVRELQRVAGALVGPKHLIFSEVLIPLEELLTDVASNAEAAVAEEGEDEREEAQADDEAAPQEGEEEEATDEAEQAPTRAFKEIMSALDDVDEVLDSPKLRQAGPERRQQLAEAVIAQLQRITSMFASLPATEREAAQKRVAPINAKLVALVRGTGPSDNAKAAVNSAQNSAADMSTGQIIDELKQVMTVLQDERLVTGDPATVGTRVAVLKGADERLELLRQASATKPESFRSTVVPVVARMQQQIAQILQLIAAMSEGVSPAEETAPPQAAVAQSRAAAEPAVAAAEDDEETQGRRAIFARIAEITDELRRGRASGMTMGPAELEPLANLWRTVAAIDSASDEEKRIGQAFQNELKAQIESGSTAASVAAQHAASDDEGAAAVDHHADAEEPVATDEETASMQTFLRTFNYIRNTLANRRLSAPSDLIPFMAMAERTLTKADEYGVNWRANEAAAALVQRTLRAIKELQSVLTQRAASASPDKATSPQAPEATATTGPAPASPLNAQLTAALQTIRANPPKTPEELEVYLEVLQQIEDTEEDVTRQDLVLFRALQEAILECGRDLGVAPGLGEADDESEDGEDDDEEGDAADESAGEPSRAAVEGRVAEILLRISDQLREGLLPEEILDQYESIVDAVSQSIPTPTYNDAITAIKEQIHLQRVQHANEAEEGAEESEEEADEEKASEEEADGEDVPVDAASEDQSRAQRQESDAIVHEVSVVASPKLDPSSEAIFREKDDDDEDKHAEL